MKDQCKYILFCLCLSSLVASTAGAEQEQPYTLRVEVALVDVDAAVVDARGRFVPGLTRENFRVFEDGQEQSLTHFASLEAPLQVVLLVEAGPAVYLIREEHLQALYVLLEQLRADDVAALARYDQQWQRLADFTRDKRLLRAQLRQLNYSLGMADLHLFDTLAQMLEWLASATGRQRGRKAVILIGTGLDTASRMQPEALRQKLAASDVTLFAVAMGSLLRESPEKTSRGRPRQPASEPESAFAAADTRLRFLAEETAGQAYFPRSGQELRAAYREIGERLRHTYSLGYVSTNRARDAAFRSLQITVVGEDGRTLPHRVLARRGYLAPRE